MIFEKLLKMLAINMFGVCFLILISFSPKTFYKKIVYKSFQEKNRQELKLLT